MLSAQYQLMDQLNISLQNSLIEVDDKLMSVQNLQYLRLFDRIEPSNSLQGENRMVNLLQVLAFSLLHEASNVFLFLEDQHLWYEVEYQDLSLQKRTGLSGEEQNWLKSIKLENGSCRLIIPFSPSSRQLIIGRSITDVIKTYIGVSGIDLKSEFLRQIVGRSIANQ